MTDAAVVDIITQMMVTGLALCAPMLVTALAVGFGISLLQALTQVQDQTLSFVPKILAVGAVLLVSANWMMHEIVSFTEEIFALLPSLLGLG